MGPHGEKNNLEEIKVNGPSREVEIRTRKTFREMGEACVSIIRLTPGCKGRIFVMSKFSTEGTLISASAVFHCEDGSWSEHV